MDNSNKTELDIEGKNGYSIGLTEFIPSEPKGIIIWLHGFGSSKDSPKTQTFAEMIFPLGIGLVAFNYPGHGFSKAGKDDFTLENCLSDFNTVEEHIRKNMKIYQ